MAESQVFDQGKVQEAIKDVIDLFASEELTVAESMHVVRVLDRTLKARYPDAYRVVSNIGRLS